MASLLATEARPPMKRPPARRGVRRCRERCKAGVRPPPVAAIEGQLPMLWITVARGRIPQRLIRSSARSYACA
jgi:hypothetical protein